MLDTLIEHKDELDSYQGKWKNLHFSKCGVSGLSKRTFNSEKSAVDGVTDSLSMEVGYMFRGLAFETTNGKLFAYKGNLLEHDLRYSHTLQIPVKENN